MRAMLATNCTLLLILIGGSGFFCPARIDAEEPLSRFCFGSCAKQDKPQPIWDAIVAQKPGLFVFLGDNIYGDTNDMNVMKQKYEQEAAIPGFQKLRATCPLIATWDDHDYGANDAGNNYPMRDQSKAAFFEFLNEPKDSPRRQHQGVYISYMYGPPGKRVQIILLDLRYFRSPHRVAQQGKREGIGAYLIDDDPKSTMMGEEQWKWLEGELKKPAEIRFIGSSVQFLADFHGVEAWSTKPLEQAKMFKLIHSTRADGVIFLSGDVHWGEIARLTQENGYPIYDVTSSGLTHSNGATLGNKQRVGKSFGGINFGAVTIDWNAPDPLITFQIRNVDGVVMTEQAVALSTLKHPAKH